MDHDQKFYLRLSMYFAELVVEFAETAESAELRLLLNWVLSYSVYLRLSLDVKKLHWRKSFLGIATSLEDILSQ